MAEDEPIRIVLWLKPAEIETLRRLLIAEQDFKLQVVAEYLAAVAEKYEEAAHASL